MKNFLIDLTSSLQRMTLRLSILIVAPSLLIATSSAALASNKNQILPEFKMNCLIKINEETDLEEGFKSASARMVFTKADLNTFMSVNVRTDKLSWKIEPYATNPRLPILLNGHSISIKFDKDVQNEWRIYSSMTLEVNGDYSSASTQIALKEQAQWSFSVQEPGAHSLELELSCDVTKI